MPKLSAYLIVKNETRDLPACLDSLTGVADELVVVDDESTDGTAALCRQRGAKVFSHKLEGFGSQKQYALERCSGDWVLSIDADERVTPELAEEIRKVVTPAEAGVHESVDSAPFLKRCLSGQSPVGDGVRRNDEIYAGYFISRRMYFLGKRLRHGGVGKDWVMRLFRRNKGRYLPLEVHEQVEVAGPTGRLNSPLDHFSYATLEEYLEKIPDYTARSARQRWQAGKRFSSWHHLRPAWELFSRVFVKGAWLDGQAGLIYAALSAHAAWLRSVKLWELEHETPK